MKIAKFFKAKVSNRCQQYKNNYEKIIVLKQDFDAALENGAKSRNLEEAKKVKIELEKILRDLELDLKFKVWKTIELGTGLKTTEVFIRVLKENFCKISDAAKFMMEQPEFTVLSEKTKFELVKFSVAELGFTKGATLEEIYIRAKERSLELCPPEVGPQLRLQYNGQPYEEYLNMAMETLKIPDGDFGVFLVGRDMGGRWLGICYVSPTGMWPPNRQFVFVRRKL